MTEHDEHLTRIGSEVRDMATGEHRGRREKSEIARGEVPDTRQSGAEMVCPACGGEKVREVRGGPRGQWVLSCMDCSWHSRVVTDAFTSPREVLADYEDRADKP